MSCNIDLCTAVTMDTADNLIKVYKLVRDGVDINEADGRALLTAIINKNETMVSYLIMLGAKVTELHRSIAKLLKVEIGG